MSNEIIDRIARAIYDMPERPTPSSADIARVAIEAMRDLPCDPGPRYSAGDYSRRNIEAFVDDALSRT